jgi:hypothetical protein
MSGNIRATIWLADRATFYRKKVENVPAGDAELRDFYQKYLRFAQLLNQAVNSDAFLSASQQQFLRAWVEDLAPEQVASHAFVLQIATYINTCRE